MNQSDPGWPDLTQPSDPALTQAWGPAAPEGQPPDDALDALVDQILGDKPRPIDWSRLDQEAEEAALAALSTWVRRLVRRYAIDTREIPPCWAEHGELIEELSALHTAHRAAYDPAGSPTGPADWHALFANTRTRLHQAISRTGCRTNEHRAPAFQEWASAPIADRPPARAA